MSYTKSHYLSVFVPSVLLGFVAALQLTGCSDAPVGLPSGGAGAGGQLAQGGKNSASGGTTSSAGEAGESTEAAGEGGETAAGGAPSNPSGGSTASGGTIDGGGTSSGGTAEATDGGSASVAGNGGQGGTLNEAVIPAACAFHTDAMDYGGSGGAPGVGGSGGSGGSGGASPFNVTLQTSPFVGPYLADAAGRTLYTYGNDLPGDCNTPPVSNCITDCLISWPIFPAGARMLAPGLDDSAFGAIHRDDGTWQTTYKGWPVYYYKTDLSLGQVAGQGKAKTWHIVEKKLPSVFIMKPGSTRYLSDDSGHTLYISSADQAGTALSAPVSNCTGSCLTTFEPFRAPNFSVVTSLLIADFGFFVRPGKGTTQVSYKGMPLYRAITDLKSGDQNGTAVSGFTAALP